MVDDNNKEPLAMNEEFHGRNKTYGGWLSLGGGRELDLNEVCHASTSSAIIHTRNNTTMNITIF